MTSLNSAGLTPTWLVFLFGNRDGSLSVKLGPPLLFLLPSPCLPPPLLTVFLVFIFFCPTYLCSATATIFQPHCHTPAIVVTCTPDASPCISLPIHSPCIKLLPCSKTPFSLKLKLSISSSQNAFAWHLRPFETWLQPVFLTWFLWFPK